MNNVTTGRRANRLTICFHGQITGLLPMSTTIAETNADTQSDAAQTGVMQTIVLPTVDSLIVVLLIADTATVSSRTTLAGRKK